MDVLYFFELSLASTWMWKLGSLLHQIEGLAGKSGIAPTNLLLKAASRDVRSPIRRFTLWPTLCWWLSPFYVVLLGTVTTMVWIGCLLTGIVGAPLTSFLMVVVWFSFLSLSVGVPEFIGWYPWDLLSLEVTWQFAATRAFCALDTQLFVLKWILFRVMFGFGKLKFGGFPPKFGWLQNLSWGKRYMGSQPMPTLFGYYSFFWPVFPFHLVTYFFMYFAEYVAPFLFLFNVIPGVFSAAIIAFLMIGIQLGGNYGEFNILTVVCTIPLLHPQMPRWPTNSLFTAIVLIGGSLNLPFNSLTQGSWWYVIGSPMKLFALVSWRLFNSYGVFRPYMPKELADGKRLIAQVEGSYDGKNWKVFHWKYATSDPSSPPCRIAPYHPRVDHQSFYSHKLFRYWNLFLWDPYLPRGASSTWIHRLCVRLMERGNLPVRRLLNCPFPEDKPPKFMRVRRFIYRFAPPSMATPGVYFTVEADLKASEVIGSMQYSEKFAEKCFDIPKPELLWFMNDLKFEPWAKILGADQEKARQKPNIAGKAAKLL